MDHTPLHQRPVLQAVSPVGLHKIYLHAYRIEHEGIISYIAADPTTSEPSPAVDIFVGTFTIADACGASLRPEFIDARIIARKKELENG